MVQAALAGGLEGGRDLTDDAADLVGGEAALVDELGQRSGTGVVGLDDPGDAVLAADVEDAVERGGLESCGAAGGVEQGAGAVVALGQAEHHDGAPEGRVVSGPAFASVALLDPSLRGVPPIEGGSRSDALQRVPLPLSVAPILGVRVRRRLLHSPARRCQAMRAMRRSLGKVRCRWASRRRNQATSIASWSGSFSMVSTPPTASRR